MADLPEPPPTDQQRETTVARLTTHTGAGHLTLAEFDERARASYQAASAAELARVTADLPALDGPRVARRQPRRWVVSLMGGSTVAGRWRLSGKLTSISVMGGSDLDLRNAELDGDEVTITSVSLMGGDDIYVPEGVDVELSGFALMGSDDEHGGPAAPRAGGPVIRIRSFSLMGGVDVWRVPADATTAPLKDARRRVRDVHGGHRHGHW